MSQRVIDTTQTVSFIPASRDRDNSVFYAWTIVGGCGLSQYDAVNMEVLEFTATKVK